MARSKGGRRYGFRSEEQSGSSHGSEEATVQEAVSSHKAQQQLPLPLHLHDDGGCGQSRDGLIKF